MKSIIATIFLAAAIEIGDFQHDIRFSLIIERNLSQTFFMHSSKISHPSLTTRKISHE